MEDFYKYISKSHNRYIICKNSEFYFSSESLAEALFERDLLIECNWDFDLLVEVPDRPNPYLDMVLPPFQHSPKHIKHDQVECWNVYQWRNKIGSFDNEADAIKFAVENNGRVKHLKDRYFIIKYINGKQIHFGTFDNLEEAILVRDKLMENNWER